MVMLLLVSGGCVVDGIGWLYCCRCPMVVLLMVSDGCVVDGIW